MNKPVEQKMTAADVINVSDLKQNQKVTIENNAVDQPYVMKAIVWQVKETTIRFKDSRKNIFVTMAKAGIDGNFVKIFDRK
jgi:hypothetical protein